MTACEKLTPQQAALLCRALGDETRLSIVEMLTEGELCACQLLRRFSVTQPTLSHHMKVLSSCGLVNVRKEGKWSHYSLNCMVLGAFRQYIGGLLCKKAPEGEG